MEKFAERLKRARLNKNLRQKDLADLLHVGQSTVAMWERGKSIPDIKIASELAKLLDVSVDFLLGIDNKIKNIEDNKLSLKQIPVYGYVAANSQHGEVAYEELLDFIVIPEGMRGDFGLIIKGDSMEPRLKDGDIAVVLKQPILENGEIGVIIINGNEGVVKKYYQSENAITLISLNENHPPIVIPKRNWDDIIIVGKVVGKYERWE
ncbi:CI-like repressor protein [Marinitoga phage MPV1]|uniref:SOS response transcriptional repressor, RecA-mediated autopeptidase n=1 Tax=Marinitoga piezophila (strain DSM 14283 / JCM 11233 / KA3) TaxID=443254 RepID=H2J420_MARPK|nr:MULTISPECIES: XRE family transcriptional regulator [Marinitoga]AEX84748.1 SOS response transcriptional repressor, RecA-mediated autopeptidase [Marinitoga piezophila KA3]